jgi:hypothetical protein
MRQVRSPGRPRPICHRVKVTPEQEARLVELAAARGFTVARLFVEATLAGGAVHAARDAAIVDEVLAVSRLLGRVGVNINQIARVTNATGEYQPGTDVAMAAMTRVAERIERLVVEVDANRVRRVPRPRTPS